MASIEEELRSAILANSSLRALIGTRVYPDVAPENPTMPCVAYERMVSAPDESSFSLDGPGLHRTTITLSCLGTTWLSAQSVAQALQSAFEGKTGSLTGTQSVELILLRDSRDVGFNELPQGYRFDVDLEIVHT